MSEEFWYFSHLLNKILSFRKENTFSFHSLTRIFRTVGFAESTHVRKNPNKFGISLTYSYLCMFFNINYTHLADKY